MPVFRLPDDELQFPDPSFAEENGLLAVGGDLSPERLLLAYSLGIFPWYTEEDPILWWSPDPRLIVHPGDIHISRSLRKTLKRGAFTTTVDKAFEEVVRGCASQPRPGQDGTWISEDMAAAYTRLHELGYAHSAETWEGDILVGGVYGVSLGSCFFGESMFARRSDASKVAFAVLSEQLAEWGFTLIDCQMYTDHLARFGAEELSRETFLALLGEGLNHASRVGKWSLDSA